MHRTFVFILLISIVCTSFQNSAQAAGMYRLFKELFSTSGSKSASEAGQAALRQADEAVSPPRTEVDDPALDAGRFIIEQAGSDVIKDGLNFDREEDYLRENDPYLSN